MGLRHIPFSFEYTEIMNKNMFQGPVELFVIISICVFGEKHDIFFGTSNNPYTSLSCSSNSIRQRRKI